jgi:hypothetical protein
VRCIWALSLATACELGSSPGEQFEIDSLGDASSGDLDDDDGDGSAGTGGLDDGASADASDGDTTGMDPDPSAGDTGVEAECPYVEIAVMAGNNLNVRGDPSTANEPVGKLPSGMIVEVLEQVTGELVNGTDVWYQVASASLEGYVSAAYAVCTLDEPPEINEDGWYLPLECGMSATVSQGNFGGTSHQNTSAYAFDFAVPLGTPLVAIASGTVTHTFDGTQPGDPCYSGGGSECFEYANYVTLRHADGTKSTYRHLQQVLVRVGEVVGLGQAVGLSGSTGWSTGRHAHVMRMEDCGEYHCQSIPVAFLDVPGDGVPDTGETVVSGNCP